MAHRSVPAPFLTKTYNLVDDQMTNDVVSWNEDGTTFVVWKTAEFSKDLLPKYFKHDNFSSFVRQLNTYGFRKTASDKWEFANENFKRGQKELLAEIRRRRTAATQSLAGAKPEVAKNSTTPANSGEYLSSSSTSSPNSKSPSSSETPGSTQIADLLNENEKLRKDNQFLKSELAQTNKQCDELMAILTRCVRVAPESIDLTMKLGCEGGTAGGKSDWDGDESENCMKLFGVVLKKKRGCDENTDFVGPHGKEIKRNLDTPWMKISATSGEGSKVCN